MPEKHPIDERFKTLHGAEVSPPDEVRESLAKHLRWGGGKSAVRTWQGRLIIVAGAMLATISAAYLGREERLSLPVVRTEQGGPGQLGSTTVRTARAEATTAPVAHHGDPSAPADIAHSETTNASAVREEPRTSTIPEPPTRVASAALADADHSGPRAVLRSTDGPEPSTIGTNTPSVPVSTEQHRGDHIASGGGSALSTDADPLPVAHPPSDATPIARPLVHDAIRMSVIPPGDHAIAGGSPHIAVRVAPYVLPAGQWWVGLYAGVGRSQGVWRGDGVEALNAAERWRGSSQGGLLLGRSWRSGWSVSAGAGPGLTRSTFSHDEQTMELFVDVDTAWSSMNYNDTEHIVYTWSIDTVNFVRPGAVRNNRARNQYGTLQVPLTVAWHGTLRRWHYGAFGGVTARIHTQREGSSLLYEARDAAPRVVDLEDNRLNGRFGMRMDAHAGFSIGFALSEHLSLFAEPLLTRPISSFGNDVAPWINGRYLQLRLQHEFGSPSR